MVSEDVQTELDSVVERSKERFDVCMSSFKELSKWIENVNEMMSRHTSVSMDAEKWLRKAEEIITTEPRWKVQVMMIWSL